MKKKNSRRYYLENAAIVTIVIGSILLLVLSFVRQGAVAEEMKALLHMNRMAERVLAVLLLIVSYNLYKRKRVPWLIAIGLTILNLAGHATRSSDHIVQLFIFLEIMILVILFWGWKDFYKKSDPWSMKKGLLLALLMLVVVFVNALLAHYSLLGSLTGEAPDLWKCITITISSIFGSASFEGLNAASYMMSVEHFIFWISWGCILLAAIFAIAPFLSKRKTTKEDLEHARKLVMAYGQNPSAYLTLEDDKTLFFGEKADGVVPYGVVGDTMIINGDPICADEDFPVLLQELYDFCETSSLHMFFLSTTEKYLEYYEKYNFSIIKCGEEPRFYLQEYNIAGKKGQKMRANINHATKAGLEVLEYKVTEQRNPQLEREFDRITSEWLSGKSSGELVFTLGGVGLDNPMDKRYFYALDPDGIMQGFIVFTPFKGGYMADVTRRSDQAPNGIMQKIMYEAFQIFKAEGYEYGSMGLAPLANVVEEGQEAKPAEKMLEFIYENLNNIYGFKNLHRAKEAYSPSSWEPGYFIWSKPLTPQMMYAVVAIQNPRGVFDYVKAFFNGTGKKLKEHAAKTVEAINQNSKKEK
ncbi:MAG: DUF2156 domain-containing protein [Hespellia sp.]|nr:DUF2156 domain-containing protein [Hespellia sp.]